MKRLVFVLFILVVVVAALQGVAVKIHHQIRPIQQMVCHLPTWKLDEQNMTTYQTQFGYTRTVLAVVGDGSNNTIRCC